MRSTRLLFALCASLYTSLAHADLRVDLITVEPGEALYERFGHTALRVYDEGVSDTVYSFGAAPFFDPSFLWKFARGEGEFMVVAEPYATTLARYHNADRTMMLQRLLLPQAQLTELSWHLQLAVHPPRNRYLYDQLYDNCATRVRDLINRVSRGALTRAASRRKPHHHYRDDTLAAMAGHPIGHWALDLLGGRHQDLSVTAFHEMYLPVALRDRLAEAQFVSDGRSTALAAPVEVVFVRHGPPLSRARQAAREVMLGLALVLSALALGLMRGGTARKRRAAAFASSVLALWSTLFGLLVVPLTLLSHVHNFSPNENAWLFWPTDLVLVPLSYRAIVHGRPGGRFFALYVALKLLSLVALASSKAAGVCTQHNLVFVAVALAVVLPMAALAWRDVRLARAFASR